MKKFFAACLIGFAIFVTAAKADTPVIIKDDQGGLISDHIKWNDRLRLSKTPVRVEGECYSACAIILDLPKEQVCVTDNATFGFHAVSDLNDHINRDVSVQFARNFFPRVLREWFMKNIIEPIDAAAKKHQTVDNKGKFLTADELIEMGVTHKCD